MNRLSHQLALDQHLSFKKKYYNIIMQIFGHETLVDVNQMAKTSHCEILNIDIYRMHSLELEQLASRKLLNPFKWLEFIIVFPLEILGWFFQYPSLHITHHWVKAVNKWAEEFRATPIENTTILHRCKTSAASFLANFFKKAEYLYFLLFGYVISPVLNIAINIVTGTARRFLAPARYIIRPSIEMAQTSPYIFAMMLGITLVTAGFLAFSIYNGLPLVIYNISLAATVTNQIAVISAATIATWTLLLKAACFIQELRDCIQQRAIGLKMIEIIGVNEKSKKEIKENNQSVKQFMSGSTNKVTELLHAINPKKAEIKPLNQQTTLYSLALFTGTESIFYPKSTTNKTHICIKEKICFKDLKDYEIKRDHTTMA